MYMTENTPKGVQIQRTPSVRATYGQARLLIRLIVVITVVLVAGFNSDAAAATYYVSPSGSDGNSGTSAQPWRTVQKAANAVAAGDTVMVKAGTYYERVQINVNGTASQPITFQGERGTKGEWLTIIDGGNPVTGWVLAPEVGPGVYKTTSIGYEPYAMTVDDRTIWRINTNSMNGKVLENARGTGFDALARPANAKIRYSGSPDITYWDGVEALFGYRNGVTYIRFRNGDNPAAKNIRSSPGPESEYSYPAGAGVQIHDKSHIKIKGFWIRAARNAVLITGTSARNNIIEENYLTNGNARVCIFGGASYNHIRNNEMKMNGLSNFQPGCASDSYAGWITYHLYHENKFIVGATTEDDHNVTIWDRGNNNEIYSNHMWEGIVGIRLWDETSGNKIYNNKIHNHSGQGFEIYRASAVIFDNLVYDNKYNMRLFNLQAGYRRLDIYRNRFHNPRGFADHVFFNAWNWVNKDSEAEIYFYHNSIAGGRNAFLIADFNPGYGMPKTYIVNNIISADCVYNTENTLEAKRDVGLFDYNWLGGASMGYRKWYGSSNVIAWNRKMWNDATLPDFALPSGSDARSVGIDLSKPFTIAGITYVALPGMTAGYFSGSKPDLGVPQSQLGKPGPPSNLRTTQ
jgi:parallel beta-helix repeat protein